MAYPIPNLPTDNLYKFVALAGLLLCAFSFVYPLHQLDELQRRGDEIELESARARTELEIVKADSVVRDMDDVKRRQAALENVYRILGANAARARLLRLLSERSREYRAMMAVGFLVGGV